MVSPKYNIQNNHEFYNNTCNRNFELNKATKEYYPKNYNNKNQTNLPNYNNEISSSFNTNLQYVNSDRKDLKGKKKHQDDAHNKINIDNVNIIIFNFRF